MSLLALGTLLALDALALAAALARQAWRRCCSPLQQQRRQRNAAADGSLDIETGSAAGSKAGSEGKAEAPAEVYSATDGNKGAAANEGANHASSRAAAAEEAVQRPDIPLKRGLSRRLVGFEARHPRSASACCCCRVACALRLLLLNRGSACHSNFPAVCLHCAPPLASSRAFRVAAASSIAISMALAGGCQVRLLLQAGRQAGKLFC